MKTIRFRYAKNGACTYISHLDVMRTMTRAVRRAKLPLWYTEGFNPHPYLTFPLPLPLGQEGVYEPMDIRIVDDSEPETLCAALAAVMPEGLSICAAAEPEQDSAQIAAAEYTLRFQFDAPEQAAAFAETAQALLDTGNLPAEKKSKKGIKTVNLCDFIRQYAFAQEADCATLQTTLAAGNSVNLNAALLSDTLLAGAGTGARNVSIIRRRLLDETGRDFS